MTSRLERDVRYLKIYAGFTTVALIALATSAFVQTPGKQKFQELDVERINVMEPDGNYRMVISNRARSIGPIAYNKPFGYRAERDRGSSSSTTRGLKTAASRSAGRRKTENSSRGSTSRSTNTIRTRSCTSITTTKTELAGWG
jgi:hypothetical protein